MAIALASLASGMIWSRQWHLLVISIGLIGLAGFLLNPLADSRSSFDLRNLLLGPQVLLSACIGQIVLAGAAFAVGLRVAAQPEVARWRVVLAVIYCVPQPAVVMAMLLVEQMWLARGLGSRPEWVGIGVSLLTLAAIGLVSVVCLLIGRKRIAVVNLISSLLLCVAGALLAAMPQALPATNQQGLAMHGLEATAPAGIAAAACLAMGFAWKSWQRRQLQKQYRLAFLEPGTS